MSIVIICGGREYADQATMFDALDRINAQAKITFVVTGGQRGADVMGNAWADARGIPNAKEEVSKQEWRERGKAAGPIRNRRMLHKYSPDLCIAFPGHVGTADMVKQAKKANLMIATVSPEGVVQWN